jgi:DNA-binding transcriptional regulator YhcF (GntR family)
MKPIIAVDLNTQIPVYKQLLQSVQELVRTGEFKEGDLLPSMNELSQTLEISKETVKRAYAILREKGVIESAQGKGFYISAHSGLSKLKVLMLFDKLSTYKFVLYRSFVENAGEEVNVTIHLHNQDIRLFENLLEENLDQYDYYIVTPHFALDKNSQSEAVRLIKKIPNRKLILLDRHIDSLKGNFGSIFQNFEEDVKIGLQQALPYLKKYQTLHIVSAPSSLYGPMIKAGIHQFCSEAKVAHTFYDEIKEQDIRAGDVYLVLNGQLDIELIDIIRVAKAKTLG